jgi:hypothetical protein
MGIAYYSVYPAGFFISAIAFAAYLLVRICVGLQGRRASARGAAAARTAEALA